MPAKVVLETARGDRDGSALKVVDPLDRSGWLASDELVAFADDRLRLWRTLQELAGVVTPFTLRVKEEAEGAVAAEREREIAALKAEHERALVELKAGFEAETVGRVREGLMALAGYGGGGDGLEAHPTRDGIDGEEDRLEAHPTRDGIDGGDGEDRRDACPTGEDEPG